METSKDKIVYVEGIRGIAALYVMLHHIMLTFRFNQLSTYQQLFINFFKYGHYAVDVFIVLSGFCLMLPALKTDYTLYKGTLHFYKKRFIRIYPTYTISIILSLILIHYSIGNNTGTLWDMSIPVSKWDITTHFLLIPDFFYDTTYKINYVLWSVVVECRIYIFFPLLLWSCRKMSVFKTLLLTVLASFSIWLFLMFLHKTIAQLNLNCSGVHPFIILFTLGMLAADVCFCGSYRKKIPYTILFFVFLLISVAIENKVGSTIKDITAGICTTFLLIGIEKNKDFLINLNWLSSFFSNKKIGFLGSFGYSIYLFHPFLIQLFWQYLIKPLQLSVMSSYFLVLFIGAPIILATCYLFFLLFERPFLTVKEKII